MICPSALSPAQSGVDIAIQSEFGWQYHQSEKIEIWYKGWIHGMNGGSLIRWFSKNHEHLDAEFVGNHLLQLDGHFAFVVKGDSWTVAAVDWVRSIPIAIAKIASGWRIDDQGDRLRRHTGMNRNDIDLEVACAIAMAGYSIDDKSLYRNLQVLAPGELFFFVGNEPPIRYRYYNYRPWRIRDNDATSNRKALADCTLDVMTRTIDSLHNRPLFIPLSAGNDSRLIASAAKHLGYKNVKCFTYGRNGNHEVKASQAIAAKLGYEWRFVPSTHPILRRFFASDTYSRYLRFSDNCTAVPFVQDMAALETLKADGYLPDDAVIANGNSGDYISGAHISPNLREIDVSATAHERLSRVIQSLYDKHFALWDVLRTPANKERILKALKSSLDHADATVEEPGADHGLYEYVEFQSRQCKYVISGQRIYEFLGHDWRMPLWDNAYLRFWEGVPLDQKAGQSLYVNMLRHENWGDVWQDIPINKLNVRPLWMVPLRWLFKAGHAPFGRRSWHRFERQFLLYWMDVTCNSACTPYWRVAIDKRGSRQSVSWLAEQYLKRHEITFSDLKTV